MADTTNIRISFLIVGTAKGGTTALAKFLSKHPQICMPGKKEIKFFSTDSNYAGTPDYSTYHKNFLPTPETKIFGEATPRYMWWEKAPERIRQYNPDMKLIFILRDPVERAYSLYQMLRQKGEEWLPFPLAIFFEPLRRLFTAGQHKGRAYLARSIYTPQILRLMEKFPREQMLFLKTEEMKGRHQETLDKVCSFLGVDSYQIPHEVVHSRKYEKISPAVRRWVWNKCRADVEALERLLSWDCSDWRPRA